MGNTEESCAGCPRSHPNYRGGAGDSFCWRHTLSSGDITDDVDLIHRDLPVGVLFSKAHRSGLVPLNVIRLDTQEDWALWHKENGLLLFKT